MNPQPKRCTECGHEVSRQARFCERCGVALRSGVAPLRAPDGIARKIISQRSAIEGERKQVTVVFTDIVRSMELTRSLDTERWAVVLDRFLAIACDAVHGFEGTVNQFTGDGLMAVFGAPLAHEDHARRACLAVLDLQRDVESFAEQLAASDAVEFAIRCGLNSGEVIVGSIGDDLHLDFAPIGNTTSLAKRMESLAPEGSAAMSASTAALVEGEFELRELGQFAVKGTDHRQQVFELLGRGSAHNRLDAGAARGLSRFVGRADERRRLDDALERALAGHGQVIGVMGEAGVGKSRLVHEFAGDCGTRGIAVTRASAVAHGRAIPLLPALAMMREFLGIRETDAAATARELIEQRLASLDANLDAELPLLFDFLGVPDPDRPVERVDPEVRQRRLLDLVTNLVHARSRHEGAVLVVEDLHWLDEASAVFLERLVDVVPATRTLLLATFRPEYGPHWAGAELISLAPLDPRDARTLLTQLLGSDASVESAAAVVQARTEGNPFFVEELVQALAETGHLEGERGAYRIAAPLSELVLPATVQAVLAARIDRLGPREKRLVQVMSVIGKEVPRALLREVSGLDARELADALRTLSQAQFLVERPGEADLAFKHPLTQEVAYASQLSAPRARAHARVAAAIERLYPDNLEERAALLAHHTEAAGDKLAAARWHARAGVWVSSSSPGESMRHWRRVRDLADALEPDQEAAQLSVLARISMLTFAWRLGMVAEEIKVIHDEGVARIGPGDSAAAMRALLDFAYSANLFTKGREREAVEVARSLVPSAATMDDKGLLMNVAAGASFALHLLGHHREAYDLTDRALSEAGDDLRCGAGLLFGDAYAFCLEQRGLVTAIMGDFPRGLADIERAIELAQAHGDPEVEAYVRDLRMYVGSLVGDFGDVTAHGERIAELSDQLGTAAALVLKSVNLARMARGEFAAAERDLVPALELVRERQVRLDLVPRLSTWIAEARLGLGRVEEALAGAEQAAAIARDRELRTLELFAQLMRARALCAKGDGGLEEARAAALRALDLAHETDALAAEPQIHAALAAVARRAGDAAEAERRHAQAARILAQVTGSETDVHA